MTVPLHPVKTDPEAIAVWKLLVKRHSLTSLLLVGLITVRALMPWRVDNLGEMTRTRRWKISLGQIGGLCQAQVDFLERYASINARRVEHVFRAAALLLLSVPVAGAVAINEVAPQYWPRDEDLVVTLSIILLLYAIFVGLMMAAAWRARDLHDLLQFEQARRQFDASRAASSAPIDDKPGEGGA